MGAESYIAASDAARAGTGETVAEAEMTARPGRVLIYGINYAPEPTGVGRYTGDIGAYLSQTGNRVEVVTAVPHYPGWMPRDGYRNRYQAEEMAGVRVVRCPLLLKSDMHGIWRLIAPLSFAVTSAPVAIWKILTMRPDTVFCVEPTLFSSPVALFFAKLMGARTVLHVQDLEIDAAFAVGHLGKGPLQKVAYWGERHLLRAFTSIVTISTGMRAMLEAKGVPAERMSIVRNWVDTNKVKPAAPDPAMREELGLSPTAFTILYAGNIGPKQALPLVLDAAEALAERPGLEFVVAGDGPEKAKLVARYGHLPNVLFLPIQPEGRFHKLLSAVDGHILPQHAGTADMLLPSKLGGMLASGKPCIVMANSGTELYDFLSEAAIMVSTDHPERLVAAITDLAGGKAGVDKGAQLKLAESLDIGSCLKALSAIILGGRTAPEARTGQQGR